MTESTARARLTVNDIGGAFLFSNNAKALSEWYTRHLGIEFTQYEGTQTYGMVEEFDYGRFAWVRDPDNNRVELYEPLAWMGG